MWCIFVEVYDRMEILRYIVTFIYVLVCIALIIVVLFQQSKQNGLSGTITGSADTFFGKNKGRSNEAKLKKFTTISATAFMIISLVLGLIVTNLK